MDMNRKFNRLDMNRKILVAMAKINILPWNFDRQGHTADARPTSTLKWRIWIGTLTLSALYALYIDMTLLYTIFLGLDEIRLDQFGIHILRAFISTLFSYWAYEVFVKHPEMHAKLYNFTQPNPGELLQH